MDIFEAADVKARRHQGNGAIMAAPYTLDLRRKVVQACERQGQSQRVVAEFFDASLSFVVGLLRRVRCSGELVPLHQRPGPNARIDPLGCQWLAYWLQKQLNLTLVKLAARLPGGEHTYRVPGAATPGLGAKKLPAACGFSFVWCRA